MSAAHSSESFLSGDDRQTSRDIARKEVRVEIISSEDVVTAAQHPAGARDREDGHAHGGGKVLRNVEEARVRVSAVPIR